MLYRICLSCTSRIPSFEVCVCLCLCLCLCVSYKLELYLQNNLLQGFSMSYVFFRPLSPVKGMPVVSPCRIFSIFCSAPVTNLTAHPKLRRCSFMLSSTCSFYLLSALFFCRPHKPDYAFLSLYSFFNFVSAGRRDSQVRIWGGSQTLTNAPLAQHTISPPFLWFSLLPPPDLTHLTAQPNLREMSL